jgi:hypothetical protein
MQINLPHQYFSERECATVRDCGWQPGHGIETGARDRNEEGHVNVKEKVCFSPSNSCQSLVLIIKLQNRLSSAIQLSKPFEFGH